MSTPETPEAASADAVAADDLVPPAPVPGDSAGTVALTAPRVRWAGIVWGLVLAAIAAAALWLLLDPARQEALTSWLLGLTPATSTAIVALLIGAFALLAGVVGIARRAQRGLERRREASASL